MLSADNAYDMLSEANKSLDVVRDRRWNNVLEKVVLRDDADYLLYSIANSLSILAEFKIEEIRGRGGVENVKGTDRAE